MLHYLFTWKFIFAGSALQSNWPNWRIDIDYLEITLFLPDDSNLTKEESSDEADADLSRLPGHILKIDIEDVHIGARVSFRFIIRFWWTLERGTWRIARVWMQRSTGSWREKRQNVCKLETNWCSKSEIWKKEVIGP